MLENYNQDISYEEGRDDFTLSSPLDREPLEDIVFQYLEDLYCSRDCINDAFGTFPQEMIRRVHRSEVSPFTYCTNCGGTLPHFWGEESQEETEDEEDQ